MIRPIRPIRLISLISLISLIGLISPIGVFAQSFQFTQNLRLGSRGEDVRELQILLNKNSETRVAQTGPGSPGQETMYFGPKTFAAALKFQQLYAYEVLVPAGIVRPTGFVGPMTRAKLNKLLVKQSSTSQQSGQVNDITPVITELKPNRGGYGTTVTISGSGFSKKTDNTIYTGYAKITGVASPDGSTLTFTIPNTIPGLTFSREVLMGVDAWLPFWISVENSSGESDSQLFTFTFYAP